MVIAIVLLVSARAARPARCRIEQMGRQATDRGAGRFGPASVSPPPLRAGGATDIRGPAGVRSMIRRFTCAAVFVFGIGAAEAAPPPKADCSKFHRMSDGRWTSVVKSRVGNPKSFVTLEPGMPIARDLTVVGINVSDTIDRLCGGQ